MEGVDYSGARPSGLCLYGKGKRFVARYFGPGRSWKHATAAEVRGLVAAGLSVVALAEGGASQALEGYDTGVAHARSASRAMVLAGMPATRPIYFAVDFDAQPKHLAKIRQYFDGAAREIGRGRVGIYAGFDVIEWAAKNGIARWFFQTYAWSNYRWSQYNHFEQYRNGVTLCGGEVDLCRNKKVDFGQWPTPTQVVGDGPPPIDESTIETPWEYVDYLGTLSNDVGSVASTLDATARIIEGLT